MAPPERVIAIFTLQAIAAGAGGQELARYAMERIESLEALAEEEQRKQDELFISAIRGEAGK